MHFVPVSEYNGDFTQLKHFTITLEFFSVKLLC